ncbi:MAG: FAD:protein FMN transferase [Salinibacterium sp.]|nr:FAD:protein FMN transferase [Salinibacterium sp.]
MRFEAIGTGWQIDTAESIAPAIQTAIHERIDVFDRTYSRFRDDSLVSRIAETLGTFEFPDDAGPLFDTYRRLYAATKGAVSPLVGHAMDDLGYDRAYSLRPTGRAGPAPSWDDAFAWDGRVLTTARPVSVDVGAAGKGYLVDIISELLVDAGHTEFIVDGSGDIRHAGSQGIRVALEHPKDPTKAIGVANLRGNSICASASNRRAWGNGLHHVIDATTGLPTRGVIATWAISALAREADGIATALFFAEPSRIEAEFDFTWARMMSDGRVECSPHLDGEIFT